MIEEQDLAGIETFMRSTLEILRLRRAADLFVCPPEADVLEACNVELTDRLHTLLGVLSNALGVTLQGQAPKPTKAPRRSTSSNIKRT